ncbi:MAG: hypothetical protein Q9166_006808 [cf. Caloplaca sp. 2 TL-2023]
MPLISALAFLPTLIIAPSFRMRLISLLGISSLLYTAHILILTPNANATRKQTVASVWSGPFLQYGPYLNGGLGSLVGLNAILIDDKEISHGGFWLLCLLPIAVFLIVILVRRVMLSVDIQGLEKLKFPYKGA